MKLRSITTLLAFALASAAAQSQVAAYATFDAQQFTRNGILANPPAGSSNSDTAWLYGPTAGAYFTITHYPKLGKLPPLKTGPIALGIDVRGDFLRTNSRYSRSDGYLNIRITPKKPMAFGVPYIEGGFGIGHTKTPAQLSYTNNLAYMFAIGVDRSLKKHIDWRIVEAGAGFLGNYNSGFSNGCTVTGVSVNIFTQVGTPTGTSCSAANHSNYIITLGTGFTFHKAGK
jgi:hypothetical protein